MNTTFRQLCKNWIAAATLFVAVLPAAVDIVACAGAGTGSADLQAEDAPRLPVCIVGAGITGASTSFFLSEFCRKNPTGSDTCGRDIVVFERSGRVGGRIESVQLQPGVFVETGAAIAIKQNRLMVYFADLLGLDTRGGSYVGNTVGILSTDRSVGMVFSAMWTGMLSFFNKMAAVWRYGLTVVSAKSKVLNLVERFEEVYWGIGDSFAITRPGIDSQSPGRFQPSMSPRSPPFASVGAMLESVGMEELTRISLFEGLERLNISSSSAYAKEMADAATRVNYNQGAGDMSAFAGFMGLSANKEDLWAVAGTSGGNAAIPTGLFKLSGAKIHLHTAVTSIDRDEADRKFSYSIRVESQNDSNEADGRIQKCASVVLAAPFLLSTIRLGDSVSPSILDSGTGRRGGMKEYTRTVATFLSAPKGLNATYFNASGWFSRTAPDLILTTEPHGFDEDDGVEIDVGLQELSLDAESAADGGATDTNIALPISSIGLVARTAESTIWKVFSKAPLSAQSLEAMFAGGVYTVLRETDWLAYPKYGAPEPITPFAVEQDPRPSRLFYASAYEIASSAMELGAIFGHNAASLVWQASSTEPITPTAHDASEIQAASPRSEL
eukprot:INCI10384.2.p1 GENE.INCI10384.2~~INCI10384.2.p1  ORF type:complete len:611 (-),score=74.33 INCI10384.2:140-1972(-)